MRFLAAILLLNILPHLGLLQCTASLSKPVASDIDVSQNRFRNKDTLFIEDELFGTDASDDLVSLKCGFQLELLWQHRLDAGIYATPSIEMLLDEPGFQIVINSVSDHSQILDRDGKIFPQWPIHLDQEAVYASPLLYDVDGDGEKDVIVITYSGQVLVIRPSTATQVLSSRDHPLHVPSLRVSKHWFDGLADEKHPPRTTATSNHSAPEKETFVDPLCEPSFVNSLTPEGLESLSLFSAARSANAKRHLFGDEHAHDEDDHRFDSEYPEEEGFVWVDAHVLSTPALLDIDGDGQEELVVAASYFFDSAEYDTFKNAPVSNLNKYVSGGIVVMNLNDWSVRWSIQLDLSTDTTQDTARIYASPTVVDLDHDGHMDIIVATSMGFVYALRSHDGSVLDGFPLEMASIQAQVSVEDIDGDGQLEMVVCDTKGNVVAYKNNGVVLWEAQMSGFSSSGVTFADIDSDGQIDVISTTTSGNIYAFSGKTGDLLSYFPVHTKGRILATPLIVDLFNEESTEQGLHVVAPSFDGNVYIVNGKSGCTSKLDIGEHGYSMVLADDIVGNKKTSLLITTMSGHVMCFGSNAPSHPLKSWRSHVQGKNGFTYRYDYFGIYILESSRFQWNVMGRTFTLALEIVDKRLAPAREQARYIVEVRLQGQIRSTNEFSTPGVKSILLESPAEPWEGPVYIRLRNEHGQIFEDVFFQSFNMYYFRIIKWLVALPAFAMCIGLHALERIRFSTTSSLLSPKRQN